MAFSGGISIGGVLSNEPVKPTWKQKGSGTVAFAAIATIVPALDVVNLIAESICYLGSGPIAPPILHMTADPEKCEKNATKEVTTKHGRTLEGGSNKTESRQSKTGGYLDTTNY